MPRPPTGAPQDLAEAPRLTGGLARFITVIAVNVGLAVAALVTSGGRLPEFSAENFQVHLLPVSAAMGLMLACRRLDLSLCALFALAAAMRANPHVFAGGPAARLALVCVWCTGIALASALVTWYGKIASSLWTALLGLGLYVLAGRINPLLAASGAWPTAFAAAVAMAVLVVGTLVFGTTGLVVPPSRPSILPTGTRSFASLAAAWALAAVVVALAAASPRAAREAGETAFLMPVVPAAGALGGTFILRGKWGALEAVALSALAHLAWRFLALTYAGDTYARTLVQFGAPLAAIPLYLFIDAAIRRRTHESAPTALLG